MSLALMISALLMGLAGSWHCTVMCGATSAAVQRACAGAAHVQPATGAGDAGRFFGQTGHAAGAWWGFQLGRLLGYAAAGAVVASSVAALSQLGQWTPALRPLWVLAHSAALGLGVWLMCTGRQPAWLARLGRPGQDGTAVPAGGGLATVAWQAKRPTSVGVPARGALRAAVAGSAWFAWPCGLLQSALMLAALAEGPAPGAAVMASFAVGSAAGLGAMPLWTLASRLARAGAGASGRAVDRTPQLLMRLAGAALAAGSAWALGHGVWHAVKAYCL